MNHVSAFPIFGIYPVEVMYFKKQKYLLYNGLSINPKLPFNQAK
jgi:hypothetical protein